MTRFSIALLLSSLSLLGACSRAPELPTPAPETSRQLGSGTVVGFADRFDTWTWLGIPFAQPPVSDLRWRAPRPALPWEGTLQALSFAPMCPQLPIPFVNDTDEPWLGDEDCLYLNVSAPRSWSPGDKPLPVMLWMHGGGNTVGSADLYNAVRNLAAREQVVTVSIHYRLGVLGWFSHPALREQAADRLDASGNFGTLDTIAALQWVRDNIHAFGGDAANVTAFGESAGGMNAFALLLSPLAENLFHRAISQSGMLITSTLASAENAVDSPVPGSKNSSTELLLRLLQADGKAGNRQQASQLLAQWDSGQIMAYLRAQSPQQLLEQMQDREMGLYPIPNLLRDGVVLPAADPLQQLQSGAFNRVPVIFGTNRDEMKTMMLRNPDYSRLRFGLFPVIEDQALYDRVTGYGSAMWKAIGADEPASAMLAAGHREVYVYRFDWDEVPSKWLVDFESMLGAAHGLEMPFVFYDVDNEMTYMPLDLIDENNLARAEPLARSMSSYWGQFAYTGAPSRGRADDLADWSRWQAEGRYLVFDTAQDGGIRLQNGAINRTAVFRELALDSAALGGQQGVCLAYTNLF
ncbi:MAG: carboxylesterase family protein, partial [Gammaproteobacteria bacterium]|nr:carboxylesterase family protein [Gammaproteobacteria bacterium]